MYRKVSGEKPRKVTPPSPSYMDNDQFAAYLKDLRQNRVARPGGARPQPSSVQSRTRDRLSGVSGTSSPAPRDDATPQEKSINFSLPRRGRESLESVNRRPTYASTSSRQSYASSHRVSSSLDQTTPLSPAEVVPTSTYMERGQRWMEKEEAGSLRSAMEDMQLTDSNVHDASAADNEEQRVYDAALNEASELVWQHRNGRGTPEPHAPYRYKPHLRKNSYQHARAASIGSHGGDAGSIASGRDTASPAPRSSLSSDGTGYSRRQSAYTVDDRSSERNVPAIAAAGPLSKSKPPVSLSGQHRRRSSMKRNISGEIQRPFSGDQIWEEPEAQQVRITRADDEDALSSEATSALAERPGNPKEQHNTAAPPSVARKYASPTEIHRNPPSQSRNPNYCTNIPAIKVPVDEDEEVAKKNGVEIRGDDIRNATSMRLRDRNPKLPTPSAVSDNPGRPIVSFDADWTAPEETTDKKPGPACRHSSPGTRTDPDRQQMAIPSIVVAEESGPPEPPSGTPAPPSIVVQDTQPTPHADASIPMIVTPDDDDDNNNNDPPPGSQETKPSARPLPTPGANAASAGRTRQTARPRSHWSPAPTNGPRSRSCAMCHECGLPIEGRFVALRGVSERFHPRCFSCFACGTGLEALEISPEPDVNRRERLDRIQRRAAGEVLEEIPGRTEAEDGDERLRFFCHLDWHELYAPRCKHCRTPILGEHIVALGEHWHYGHFFCAECGDPFEQGMTHIEKDGYAWCINCQTRRTERRAPKCKMCGKAVIGQYIQALGGEWHDECFRCSSCHGGFDDGQIFPREQNGKMTVACTACRMRELKA